MINLIKYTLASALVFLGLLALMTPEVDEFGDYISFIDYWF